MRAGEPERTVLEELLWFFLPSLPAAEVICEAVEGARVFAQGDWNTRWGPSVFSDAKGNFRITGLPPGSYKAAAESDTGFGIAQRLPTLCSALLQRSSSNDTNRSSFFYRVNVSFQILQALQWGMGFFEDEITARFQNIPDWI